MGNELNQLTDAWEKYPLRATSTVCINWLKCINKIKTMLQILTCGVPLGTIIGLKLLVLYNFIIIAGKH